MAMLQEFKCFLIISALGIIGARAYPEASEWRSFHSNLIERGSSTPPEVEELLQAGFMAWIDAGMPDFESDSSPNGDEDVLKLMSKSGFKSAINEFFAKDGEKMKASNSGIYCSVCQLGVGTILNFVKNGFPPENITPIVKKACVAAGTGTQTICDKITDFIYPQIHFIFSNRPNLTKEVVCGIILQNQGCGIGIEWDLNLDLGAKPPVKQSSEEIELMVDYKPLKVLHLSDPHMDIHYKPGSNAVCSDPMCCNEDSGVPIVDSHRAGFWGDYRSCDMPAHTIKTAIEHIAKTHKDLNYIMITGDFVAHNLWSTSIEENIEIVKQFTNYVAEAFPGIGVIPVLGNHEPHPVNSFPNPDATEIGEFNSSWVYEEIGKLWSQWLPTDALASFQKGGHYAIQVAPGLRVVVINSNLCYIMNWWLLYDHDDPGNQLKWLAKQLAEAEQVGDKVHILGHVPPSEECWKEWVRKYAEIIDRFEDTVAAQFFGHTHKDEFRILFSTSDEVVRPIKHLYLGPSLTTFSKINAGYRIYHVDGNRENASWNVLDHETWVFNLTAANESPEKELDWFKLYSFRDAYGVTSASPHSHYQMIKAMTEDEKAFDKFYGHYAKGGDSLLSEGCDDNCRKELICKLLTTVYGETPHCDFDVDDDP